MNKNLTLIEFLEQCSEDKIISYRLNRIVRALAQGALELNDIINSSQKSNIYLGSTNCYNVHGDLVQKFDEKAHQIFTSYIINSESCCALISEEAPEPIPMLNDPNPYIVALDPLDGSSNIDVNNPIGTIFSVYTSLDASLGVPENGHRQVIAGYFLYSTVLNLVIAHRSGVSCFMLDKDTNTFTLQTRDLRIPHTGKIYCVNMGNYPKFSSKIRAYVDSCASKNYSLRYSAAMVSDIHRILLKGGVFIYPSLGLSEGKPKLRLVYECNPIAYIIKKAGGLAVSDTQPVLDIPIKSIHQKSAILIGSREEVLSYLRTST